MSSSHEAASAPPAVAGAPAAAISTETLSPTDHQWNRHAPTVHGAIRKGGKQYQEDAFCTFISPNGLVFIGAIFDGHGGYNGLVASSTARDFAYASFEGNRSCMQSWSVQQWQQYLTTLFEHMHDRIRQQLLSDIETSDQTHTSSLVGGKRYQDEHGVVRTTNGDPVLGGSTCTITVMLRNSKTLESDSSTATLITANAGDSTALLLQHSSEYAFLTTHHGPENPDEYMRIAQLPATQKLLFVYHTNQRHPYDCPLVFLSKSGLRDLNYVDRPWSHGLHPSNVRDEPATYAVTPKHVVRDRLCIAVTRTLGDFYGHQFGLTSVPSIGVKQLVISERGDGDHPLAAESFTIVLASDGVWDCWKYEEFHAYVDNLRYGKQLTIREACEATLEQTIHRAVSLFGEKDFDDATLIMWRFC